MKPLNAQQIADVLGADVAAGDPAAVVCAGVSTDTRKLPAGCAFFALRGENFDGDAFAADALAAGAALVVVHRWSGDCPAGAAVIVVPDTLAALQRLAYWWRRQLDIPVVCITGSNGKTSTKDLTTAVLSRRFRVSSTKGNLNNHIGLPLTVLATTLEDQAAVWEIGMNHAGELEPLCKIAQPKYGIITNIGTAHIEHLGSRDAIAEEKGTLARALPDNGILFISASCDYHDFLRERTKAALVSVGDGRGIVRAENLRLEADRSHFTLVIEGDGHVKVCLPVPGRHMVINALLAAAVGWKLGMPPGEIASGLNEAKISSGRLARRVADGVTVIDDTYNANPESMAAAIETLAEAPVPDGARRFAVLGRMGELGIHGPAAHHQIGELAASHGLVVIAAGEGAEGIAEGAGGAKHFPVLADAAKWLAAEVRPGDAVLFKGSRSATIERVMNAAFPPN
ncbi:MAG: UDP-N-acetylmuramoyl-tripeptide--D-alanyl-D-alanine ligase [Verrucomicrobia bacterium]|nr:UDP-N-acetylmuramoyl-tripeptide--D-alanyl-D-alanine ligase [Verrucomicrobiota bacterium]